MALVDFCSTSQFHKNKQYLFFGGDEALYKNFKAFYSTCVNITNDCISFAYDTTITQDLQEKQEWHFFNRVRLSISIIINVCVWCTNEKKTELKTDKSAAREYELIGNKVKLYKWIDEHTFWCERNKWKEVKNHLNLISNG